MYDLIAVFIRCINKERDEDTDDDIGDDGADAAENGEGGAFIGVGCDGRCHGAIGDIDGGIEKASPDEIGREHIGDAKSHRCIRNGALIHQKAEEGDRQSDTADPWTEFPVFLCFGAIGDPSHADIGEGIEKARNHEQQSDKPRRNAENFGIKDHEKDAGKGKHEVIAEVADEISELIGGAEWGDASIHVMIFFLRDFLFSFLVWAKRFFFIQIFFLYRGEKKNKKYCRLIEKICYNILIRKNPIGNGE